MGAICISNFSSMYLAARWENEEFRLSFHHAHRKWADQSKRNFHRASPQYKTESISFLCKPGNIYIMRWWNSLLRENPTFWLSRDKKYIPEPEQHFHGQGKGRWPLILRKVVQNVKSRKGCYQRGWMENEISALWKRLRHLMRVKKVYLSLQPVGHKTKSLLDFIFLYIKVTLGWMAHLIEKNIYYYIDWSNILGVWGVGI